MTKKQTITDLLLSSDFLTDDEIADKTGTTTNYVKKVRWDLRKKGLFPRGSSASTSESNNEIARPSPPLTNQDLATNASATSLSNTAGKRQRRPRHSSGRLSYDPRLEAEALTEENRRTLWTDFLVNKPLPEIIKERGTHPELVWYEYQQFLKLNGFDVHGVQVNLIQKIAQEMGFLKRSFPDDVEQFQRVVEEFNSKGYVGSQFSYLLDLCFRMSYREGKLSIHEIEEELPTPWKRPLCYVCKLPIRGVILDPSVGEAKELLEKRWYHPLCRNSSLGFK